MVDILKVSERSWIQVGKGTIEPSNIFYICHCSVRVADCLVLQSGSSIMSRVDTIHGVWESQSYDVGVITVGLDLLIHSDSTVDH